jgi:hypothetical protein
MARIIGIVLIVAGTAGLACLAAGALLLLGDRRK